MESSSENEKINNNELIEYIVIAKDTVNEFGISPEKIAVHVAHVSDIYTFHCLRNGGRKTLSRFLEWYNEGRTQKKVLLGATQKQIEKITTENKIWTVADIGYNQVPEGTMIAFSLGILTRQEKNSIPVIKRLQIYRYPV